MMFKKFIWLFNLVAIALCVIFVGRAAASFLILATLPGDGPPMPRRSVGPQEVTPQQGTKDIEAVLARNIFCSTCAPVSLTPDKKEKQAGTTPQRSSLNMQLLATMVAPNDSEWSMAVIRDNADAKRGVRIYKRGDTLPLGGAIVAQVVTGRVYFVISKRIEFLDATSAPPPPVAATAQVEPVSDPISGLERDIDKGVRCSGSLCEVDKSLIDKVLANTTALATWARFMPSIKDNKPNGFKLYAIRPGSIFAKIGMQNADLIKAINGLDMSTPDRALEAYTKLKTASHLTVLIERRGQNMTLDYQIR